MRRFFVDERIGTSNKTVISGQEAIHAKNVLRLKAGDRVIIFDGSGMEFTGVISRISKGEVHVDIVEARSGKTEPHIRIVLGQGIPKSDKMDLIVQKATELGATSIVPLHSMRVLSRDVSPGKLDRWRKIAVEAAKQSGRAKVPEIPEPETLENFTNSCTLPSLRLIPWEREKSRTLRDALSDGKDIKDIYILVGPEGGFAEEEVRIAEEAGFLSISLGNRILRTETVALSIISILQYDRGDLS